MNAWILCIPFLVPAFILGALRKEIAARMADMTGYTRREKFFTVAASLAPYPFMLITVWTPFTALRAPLYGGLLLYGVGLAGFYASILVFARTPSDQPLSRGVYRFSRNPMYVSASLVFLGICCVTANPLLFVWLAPLLLLQHFMILAEERICGEKYGPAYAEYARTVPRYLIF